METEALIVKPQPSITNRLLPAVVPVLFVAITYVDPGKWVAAVEGGALFGYDLVLLMFAFSLAAVVCQYLSACIAVVTGRDLAQETGKAKFVCMCLATVALLSYLFGVLMSQPDASLSVGGMLTELNGESAFALMSLLGASIMPHNFYVYSSIVQQNHGAKQVSKEALCHDHLFAISFIFSGIFLVNYVLMNSAANVFHNTGLDLRTFQDASSLMDQVFRNLMAPVALILILLLSNHTTALTWKFSGQAVVQNFFKVDIPGWCHHSTIRFIAIIPALLCSWHSGAEGTYQLLIFTQILVALLLPSSVIPIFRVASSRSVMGVNKISQFVEFLVLITYIGMLGLAIVFVIEMVFGNSDWASSIRWSHGGSLSAPYIILLVTAFFSLSLMLWLVVTPLKSASPQSDALKWDDSVHDYGTTEANYRVEDFSQKQERTLSHEKSSEHHLDLSRSSPDLDLPEVLLDSDKGPHLTTIEDSSVHAILTPSEPQPEESTKLKMVSSSVVPSGVSDGNSLTESVRKTFEKDGNLEIVKDQKPEESRKVVSETNQCLTSEGPGSFRSLGGKGDDAGGGGGSLSKLAGLGRASRRQLAAILDEFWGQMFDFHGEPTEEAKTRKLDRLLGIDSSAATSKVESCSNEFNGYIPSVGGGGSDSLIESAYGVQRGSSSLSLSCQRQLLDAYAQISSLNVMDPAEKRYHSLCLGSQRFPQVSCAYDDQPATVHGYQIKSYINQMEPLAPKSPSLVSSNYKAPHSLTKTMQNGLSPAKPPGFPDPLVSRNNSMQPERTDYRLCTTQPAVDEKRYYSMPDISGRSLPYHGTLGRKVNGLSVYSSLSQRSGTPPGFINFSYSNFSRDTASNQVGSGPDTWSMWSRQPFEKFGVAEVGSRPSSNTQETASTVDLEANLLKSFRLCVVKLLKLEGSNGLFKQNSGLDEDLVGCVAARERLLYEAESKVTRGGDSHSCGPGTNIDESEYTKFLVTSVPNCGEGCVWRVDLITSFGVWCIHRVLELSLMESRPELWGKYTYVLNRLQGIIKLAFSKPRTPMNPCFCLQLPNSHHQLPSLPKPTTSLPPPVQQSREKCTTAASLLEIVKDIEIAISCRKGRSGATAGDVAFPKGKENLASVLKRYKRRLSNMPDSVNRVHKSPVSSITHGS